MDVAPDQGRSDLGDEFAEWADESLEWTRLTGPAAAEAWRTLDGPDAQRVADALARDWRAVGM